MPLIRRIREGLDEQSIKAIQAVANGETLGHLIDDYGFKGTKEYNRTVEVMDFIGIELEQQRVIAGGYMVTDNQTKA